MSHKASGILGLILLPIAFLLFIGTSGPHHTAEPVQASIEPETAIQTKAVAAPHQRLHEAAPAPLNAPALAAQPVPQNIPPQAMQRRKLAPMPDLVQDAWKQFQVASDARPDASDVESLPRQLFPVSAAVARVAMAMRQDPNAIPQGIQFFRGCAAADSDLYSVRAVCMRNLVYWQTVVGQNDLPEVPDEVARIVKALPPAR